MKVTLREAAAILGKSIRATESALRRAGIRSGYDREAVKGLAEAMRKKRRETR
jgi:predicted HTH domain antitoxin